MKIKSRFRRTSKSKAAREADLDYHEGCRAVRVRVGCYVSVEMKKVIDATISKWYGPKEGGNPTIDAFVKEAIEEKMEREREKSNLAAL